MAPGDVAAVLGYVNTQCKHVSSGVNCIMTKRLAHVSECNALLNDA